MSAYRGKLRQSEPEVQRSPGFIRIVWGLDSLSENHEDKKGAPPAVEVKMKFLVMPRKIELGEL